MSINNTMSNSCVCVMQWPDIQCVLNVCLNTMQMIYNTIQYNTIIQYY